MGESYAENISLILDSAFLSLLPSELTQSKSDLFSTGGPFSVKYYNVARDMGGIFLLIHSTHGWICWDSRHYATHWNIEQQVKQTLTLSSWGLHSNEGGADDKQHKPRMKDVRRQ